MDGGQDHQRALRVDLETHLFQDCHVGQDLVRGFTRRYVVVHHVQLVPGVSVDGVIQREQQRGGSGNEQRRREKGRQRSKPPINCQGEKCTLTSTPHVADKKALPSHQKRSIDVRPENVAQIGKPIGAKVAFRRRRRLLHIFT